MSRRARAPWQDPRPALFRRQDRRATARVPGRFYLGITSGRPESCAGGQFAIADAAETGSYGLCLPGAAAGADPGEGPDLPSVARGIARGRTVRRRHRLAHGRRTHAALALCGNPGRSVRAKSSLIGRTRLQEAAQKWQFLAARGQSPHCRAPADLRLAPQAVTAPRSPAAEESRRCARPRRPRPRRARA